MKSNRMAKGVHVTISNDLSNTDRTHQTNNDMIKMKGNTYKIEAVQGTSHGTGAYIGGYVFHPSDLIELSPRKKKQEFHFEVKELII